MGSYAVALCLGNNYSHKTRNFKEKEGLSSLWVLLGYQSLLTAGLKPAKAQHFYGLWLLIRWTEAFQTMCWLKKNSGLSALWSVVFHTTVDMCISHRLQYNRHPSFFFWVPCFSRGFVSHEQLFKRSTRCGHILRAQLLLRVSEKFNLDCPYAPTISPRSLCPWLLHHHSSRVGQTCLR